MDPKGLDELVKVGPDSACPDLKLNNPGFVGLNSDSLDFVAELFMNNLAPDSVLSDPKTDWALLLS